MARAAAKTTKKTAAKAPERTRQIQVSARLTEQEHADLLAVIEAYERDAKEKGFETQGFGAWLRAMIYREKKGIRA